MFNFPVTERSNDFRYERNFLKSVTFHLKFKDFELTDLRKESIIEHFKESFPRYKNTSNGGFKIELKDNETPIVHPIDRGDSYIELKSESGQQILSFTEDYSTLTISGNEYINFESAIETISKVISKLKEFQVSNFIGIAIRKINLIDISIPENNNAMQIMEMLLNDNLVSNVSYFPSASSIKNNIHSIRFNEGNYYLNLAYGFVVETDDSGKIILDIDLSNNNVLPPLEITNALKEINSEIFNIFNWTLSEETRNYLNKPLSL